MKRFVAMAPLRATAAAVLAVLPGLAAAQAAGPAAAPSEDRLWWVWVAVGLLLLAALALLFFTKDRPTEDADRPQELRERHAHR